MLKECNLTLFPIPIPNKCSDHEHHSRSAGEQQGPPYPLFSGSP